jgi:hypothetical protein
LLFFFYLLHKRSARDDRAMSAGTAKGVRYICFSQKPSVCVLDFWFSLQCPVSCRGEKQRESESGFLVASVWCGNACRKVALAVKPVKKNLMSKGSCQYTSATASTSTRSCMQTCQFDGDYNATRSKAMSYSEKLDRQRGHRASYRFFCWDAIMLIGFSFFPSPNNHSYDAGAELPGAKCGAAIILFFSMRR